VNGPLVAAAALLLALERMCYVWIARAPASFSAAIARAGAAPEIDRTVAVGALCAGFKLLQGAVFLSWCLAHGAGRVWPPEAPLAVVAAGVALILGGQALSVCVFWRLGFAGVFYGDRFGHLLPWCRTFPFSWFAHPQYLGVVLSIWGLFLVLRFPQDDWAILPLLETVYYAVGARLERSPGAALEVAGQRP
jgi:methylene-fatty-acyl-phospholipid synthase